MGVVATIAFTAALLTEPSPGPCDATPVDTAAAAAHLARGEELFGAGALEEAERELTEAVLADPTRPIALFSLGQARMALKRYAEAVAVFKECRARLLCPRADEAIEKRALDRQLRLLNDTLRGLERDRMAGRTIKWREINDGPQRNRWSDVQALEKAIWELQRWRNRKQGEPATLALALGNAHFLAGDLAAAETEFARAIERESKLGDAHYNLSVVYLATGRIPDAEKALARAEKLGVPVAPRLREEIQRRKP